MARETVRAEREGAQGPSERRPVIPPISDLRIYQLIASAGSVLLLRESLGMCAQRQVEYTVVGFKACACQCFFSVQLSERQWNRKKKNIDTHTVLYKSC